MIELLIRFNSGNCGTQGMFYSGRGLLALQGDADAFKGRIDHTRAQTA